MAFLVRPNSLEAKQDGDFPAVRDDDGKQGWMVALAAPREMGAKAGYKEGDRVEKGMTITRQETTDLKI